jgi:hypothetical protein
MIVTSRGGLLKTKRKKYMPKYVIEREIPNLGDWSADDLKGASKKSNSVLKELGPQIEWLQSLVTADKLYCIYKAPNEEMVLAHARQGGFPANSIAEVKTMIGPFTADD